MPKVRDTSDADREELGGAGKLAAGSGLFRCTTPIHVSPLTLEECRLAAIRKRTPQQQARLEQIWKQQKQISHDNHK